MANKKVSAKPTEASSSRAPLPPNPATFSTDQATKAVNALYAHHQKVRGEKEKTQLISKEEHVWLCVNTKVMPKKKSNKPFRIQLPNPPLPPPPTSSVCLISKTPQREYKDLLAAPEHNIKFVSRVVGVEKLRGKHAPYEARRRLCSEHDVFLCDERVMEMMPKLLGKTWFDAKKQPIPVNLTRKDLKGELSRAISSTYFHESLGTSTSIRIATASHHTPEQTAANLLAAIPQVIAKLQARYQTSSGDEEEALASGWDLVHSIGIKTSGSIMLPIWSCKMDSRFEIVDDVAVKTQKKRKGEDASDDDDVDMEKKKAVKKVKAAKEDKAAKSAAKSPAEATATSPAKVTTEQASAAAPATQAVAAQPKKVMAGKPAKEVKQPAKKVSVTKAKPSAKQAVVGRKPTGAKR